MTTVTCPDCGRSGTPLTGVWRSAGQAPPLAYVMLCVSCRVARATGMILDGAA